MADKIEPMPMPEPDPELMDVGRRMFAGPVDFVMGAVSLETLPSADRVEVAFAGRSNVGKSSLINALTGRNTLARTSNTPGRTQELNYFRMGDDMNLPLHMVDLPGYGYAKVERKKVEKWTRLIKTYLLGRAPLRRVLLLIDSRHGLKANDVEIMKMLDETAVSYQIVLTKLDKLKVAERAKIVQKTQQESLKHPACHPLVIGTSSEKGIGLDVLRAEVAGLARMG